MKVPKAGFWRSMWRPMSIGEWADKGDQIFVYQCAQPQGWQPVERRFKVSHGLHLRTKRPMPDSSQ
jgi:hypothetical protein